VQFTGEVFFALPAATKTIPSLPQSDFELIAGVSI
jgi:hypothetical protein